MTQFLAPLTPTGTASATSAVLSQSVDSEGLTPKKTTEFANFIQTTRQSSQAGVGDATRFDADATTLPEIGATEPEPGDVSEVRIPPIPTRAKPIEPESKEEVDQNAKIKPRMDGPTVVAGSDLHPLNSKQKSQMPERSVFVKDHSHLVEGAVHRDAPRTDTSASAVEKTQHEISNDIPTRNQTKSLSRGEISQFNPIIKSASGKDVPIDDTSHKGRIDPTASQGKITFPTQTHTPPPPEPNAIVRPLQTHEPKLTGIDERVRTATNPQLPPRNSLNTAGKIVQTVSSSAIASISVPPKETPLVAAGTSENLHFDSSFGPTQSQANATTGSMPVTRLDMARGVAHQMQNAVPSMSDRPVDLSLNPDELGKVKLSITTTNGSVVLQVLAERPETLDLMRRHADILAEELGDLGFDSIDLSFGEGQSDNLDDMSDNHSGSRASHSDTPNDVDITPDQKSENAHLSITLDGSGALDIRV